MTDYFVDANGDNSDGLSWGTAWTTTNNITGVSGAGNRILIAYDTDDRPDADMNFLSSGTQGSPLLFFSADPADSLYRKGAIIGTSTSNANDVIFNAQYYVMRGIKVWPYNDFDSSTADAKNKYIDCDWATGAGSASDDRVFGSNNGGYYEFVNNEIVLVSGSEFADTGGASHLAFRGGSASAVSGTLDALVRFLSSTRTEYSTITGMDLTDVATINVIVGAGGSNQCDLSQSAISSGAVVLDATADHGFIRGTMRNCENGTLTTAPFKEESLSEAGETDTVTSVYRTGGADDGEQATPISVEMTAFEDMTINACNTVFFDLAVDLDTTGSKTFKVHVAHGASGTGVGAGTSGDLLDTQFWIEVIGPSSAGTPTAAAHWEISGPGLGAAGSDCPDEAGETWTGLTSPVQQSASVTYTTTIEGLVTVRVHFASNNANPDGDATIYVDPKIVVS